MQSSYQLTARKFLEKRLLRPWGGLMSFAGKQPALGKVADLPELCAAVPKACIVNSHCGSQRKLR